MGYSVTVPSGLSNITSGGIGTVTLGLTTVPANTSCGSITTPNYKQPLSRVTVDMRIQARSEDSGSTNYIDFSSGMYIGLNDGATFSCGAFPEGSLKTPANGWMGETLIRGRTNVVARIKPNTNYTCQIMFGRAIADTLYIYNPSFEMNMFFGSE